ncbi:MAG: sensor histidine kinase [Microthrixaceae bacterium]
MKRRIATTVIGAVAVALLLAGLGTLVLSRASSQRAAGEELRRQAAGVAEVVSSLAELSPLSRDAPDPGGAGPGPDGRPGGRVPRRALERIQEQFRVQDVGLSIVPPGEDPGEWLSSEIVWSDDDLATLVDGGDTVGTTRDGARFAAAGRSVGSSTVVVTLVGATPTPIGSGYGWFLVSSAAVILLATAAAVRLGSRLAQPIQEATDVTSRIATGDLGARLPTPDPRSDDEAAVLARSINTMADTLERSKGLEQQFLLSVSHDLRTPLTSIKGYAEATTVGAVDDPARAAEVIAAESRRLERLVHDLLDLAHLDAHQFTLHPVSVDVSQVVAEAARHLQPQVARAGLRLEADPGTPATGWFDPDRVAQIVGNLVGNALRYARTVVVVRTEVHRGEQGAVVVVSVSDDGPGLPAADLPHVFERLYQSRHEPLRQESTSGLGLAIVRELVGAMGGDVGADSPAAGGTVVWFRLPLR